MAFVARLSGLRAIAERCHVRLGTASIASLSEAQKRPSSLRFCQSLVLTLESRRRLRPFELVALDSMAVTLPRTQRHRCAKVNDKTVGGGVLWAYRVEAARGTCPVKVLRVTHGAWYDSRLIEGVALEPRGPVHLMDRGFYALHLLQHWLEEGVRFIVRAKSSGLVWEDIETRGPVRRAGTLTIVHDGLVRMGGAYARAYPVVRLVIARPPRGEDLILVSSLWDWTAEALLAAYRKRWHIERFHRFVKEALGLAHLYSFHWAGLQLLMHVALLLALLLFLGAPGGHRDTIDVLQATLLAVRAALGLAAPWKRNTVATRRAKRSKTRKPRSKNP